MFKTDVFFRLKKIKLIFVLIVIFLKKIDHHSDIQEHSNIFFKKERTHYEKKLKSHDNIVLQLPFNQKQKVSHASPKT